MNILILIQLLLAHVLADFVFQTGKWVKKKNAYGLRSVHFWIHILLAGLLSYLVLMQWSNWFVPLVIILSHGIIDSWKMRQEQNRILYFFIDQMLHILVIVLLWLFLTHGFSQVLQSIAVFLKDIKSMVILTAFVLVIWPAGTIIGKITEPLRSNISDEDSLPNAGIYIGILERILVLIFVLLSQFAAIGFLVAGKSILRVARDNDKEARKKTEYVLIGTLISFASAIITGLLAMYIISGS